MACQDVCGIRCRSRTFRNRDIYSGKWDNKCGQQLFDPQNLHTLNLFGRSYSLSVVIVGALVALFAASVIIGGLKRISKVAEVIVPFMAVLYVVTALVAFICNIDKFPAAISEIISSAFGFRAAAGGALGSVIIAMRQGIARGIFSNEAGLGSAPIAAAAAHTDDPATGTCINDRNIHRYDHHLYDDRSYDSYDGNMEYRAQRGRCDHKSFSDGTSASSQGLFVYFDGMSDLFCIYNDTWMGLLQ